MNWRTEESGRTSAISAVQRLQTDCTSVDTDDYTTRCQSVCNVISAQRPLLKGNTWRDTCKHNTLTRSRLYVNILHVTKLLREKTNCRITTECTQMRRHISVPFVEKPTDTGKINNNWSAVTERRKDIQAQIEAKLLSSATKLKEQLSKCFINYFQRGSEVPWEDALEGVQTLLYDVWSWFSSACSTSRSSEGKTSHKPQTSTQLSLSTVSVSSTILQRQ